MHPWGCSCGTPPLTWPQVPARLVVGAVSLRLPLETEHGRHPGSGAAVLARPRSYRKAGQAWGFIAEALQVGVLPTRARAGLGAASSVS